VKRLGDEIKSVQEDLEIHRQEAQKSHEYYTEACTRCASEWKEITTLDEKSHLSEEEAKKLRSLKHKFNIVISADYQMEKLVPYWGLSAQPGSTYYLQKLNHDIFGIVNHATDLSSVYLFDEQVGSKIPTTLSLIFQIGSLSFLTGFIVFTYSWTIHPAPTKTVT